jgi:hypothetical protein
MIKVDGTGFIGSEPPGLANRQKRPCPERTVDTDGSTVISGIPGTKVRTRTLGGKSTIVALESLGRIVIQGRTGCLVIIGSTGLKWVYRWCRCGGRNDVYSSG